MTIQEILYIESFRDAFILTGTSGPVSYTHLDVYKRQVKSPVIKAGKTGAPIRFSQSDSMPTTVLELSWTLTGIRNMNIPNADVRRNLIRYFRLICNVFSIPPTCLPYFKPLIYFISLTILKTLSRCPVK